MTDHDFSHELVCGQSGLRVRFRRASDRFEHIVDLAGQPEEGAMRSIEGSSTEAWPASPAIQQLSTEQIEGATMLMGVGGSGTSHFSLSVRCATSSDGMPSIHFDWAARLTKASMATWLSQSESEQPPESQDNHSSDTERIDLGSEYAMSRPWSVEVEPPARLIEIPETVPAKDPHAASESVSGGMPPADGKGRIRVEAEIQPGEQTVRWSYRIGR